MVNNKRILKSLRTKDYQSARSIKSFTEMLILKQLSGLTQNNAKLSFNELIDRFLTTNHHWSDFNCFARFAYYTGARSGEIRSTSRDNVLEGSISRP